MDQEIKSLLKKTAKIAGVTCVATGAIALMTSAAALKAVVEGGKYLKDSVKKILDEQPEAEQIVEEAAEAPAGEEAAEESPAAEETV